MEIRGRSWKRFLKALGPGFITGAADDDPSGIATYAQAGAQFGYTQLWVALFSYPFMTVIQEMCGRIGMVTGDGLSGVIKKHYSQRILFSAVFLLFLANTINIGADLGAMAASLQLLVPVPFVLLLVSITIFTLLLEIFVPYPTYAKFLKYLALSLLAYVAVAFVTHQDWGAILHATLIPHVSWTKAYLLNIAALLGTTISPYLFFWQADEEVEEEIVQHKIRGMGRGVPKVKPRDIRDMRVDTAVGMFFSNMIAFFIIVTAASTLGASGFVSINTAADAANALRPLVGGGASLLFTLGIIGTGLLAVPVLAGSAGYAVSEAFGWEASLGDRFKQAPSFYGVIAIATLLGLVVNFSGIGAMKMLYYTAILNGVLAPPLMILILLIGNNKTIMREHTNSGLMNALGILITTIMGVVALAIFYTVFI